MAAFIWRITVCSEMSLNKQITPCMMVWKNGTGRNCQSDAAPLRNSPATDATNIDVYELFTLVIAYSAFMQPQCRVAKLSSANTRHPDIDCHCLHVQAVLRHGGRTAA
jgi:hypothetical protein